MSRGNFRSDNEAGVAPQIMQALMDANQGSAHSYGEDQISARLQQAFNVLFEREVGVFPLATGTGANALCMAQMVPPYGAAFCHHEAHLNVDECGAPEFYSGGAKLVGVDGEHALIDPAALARMLEAAGVHGEHECMPAAVSLTQATEMGAVYSIEHVRQISAIARQHGLGVHMDGARFANAVATLGCTPADLSWRAGIDMLSFGASKNGAMAAEAIIVFDPALTAGLARRRKRGGHLLSKMRFVSAQLEASLRDDLWLTLATRSNAGAQRLSDGLASLEGVNIMHPTQSNEVFVQLPDAMAQALELAGFEFHRWPGADGVYRLIVSFETPAAHIEDLLATARAVCVQLAGG